MPQEKRIAEKLTREIRKVAEQAKTEEDLRIGVESALRPILQELGIQTRAAVREDDPQRERRCRLRKRHHRI